jgi:hypothetical protein
MKRVQVLESTEITSTPPVSNGFFSPTTGFDLVARLTSSTASDSVTVKVAPTEYVLGAFFDRLSSAQRDVGILQHLVKWQHKVIDYNSSYIALLMDQIDEEEFERVSEGYANEIDDYVCLDLSYEIDRIQSLTDLPYTPMDYSNLLNVSEDKVEYAIERIDVEDVRAWSEGAIE